MGLFNRKSSRTSNADSESTTSNSARNSAAMKSPLSARRTNGSTFGSSPSLPDVTLPRPPDPSLDPATYLRSIYAVRERTKLMFELAKKDRLAHFKVDMRKYEETAAYVVSIIKVGPDYTCLLTRS